MIQLENVHKSYGQTKVLKGIDLQIQDQDDVVILGPSGSGKSTLLNVLSGLEKVDEGHILIQGQDLSQLRDAQLTAFRREKIAFIFQQYYLLPNLTVRQNVKMGADLASNHDFLKIIEDLVEELKKKKMVFVAGGVGTAPVYPQVKCYAYAGSDAARNALYLLCGAKGCVDLQ